MPPAFDVVQDLADDAIKLRRLGEDRLGAFSLAFLAYTPVPRQLRAKGYGRDRRLQAMGKVTNNGPLLLQLASQIQMPPDEKARRQKKQSIA